MSKLRITRISIVSLLLISMLGFSLHSALTARARAFSAGRAYVTPQDVKDMVHDVLRHRILLSYEAEAEEVSTDQILDRILAKVPVP